MAIILCLVLNISILRQYAYDFHACKQNALTGRIWQFLQSLQIKVKEIIR